MENYRNTKCTCIEVTMGFEFLTYSSFFASSLPVSILVHLGHDKLPLRNESSHGSMTTDPVCLEIFK